MRNPAYFMLGIALLSAAAWSIARPALADDRGYIGVISGFALPSPGAQSFTIGVKGAYKIVPIVRTSLYFYTFGSGAETDASALPYVDAFTRTNLFGGDATFHFFTNARIGATIGLERLSSQVRAQGATGSAIQFEDSGSGLYLGPVFQYDVPVGRFTLGGEAMYAYALSSSVPKTLLLLATVKFWF